MKQLFRRFREPILFLLFGGATTLVNYMIYYSVRHTVFRALSAELSLNLSNAVAWVFAVVFAFFMNKIFVFESRGGQKRVVREAISFFACRIVTGVIEILLPGILVGWGFGILLFGDEGLIPKTVTTVLITVLNYLSGKLLVFRKNRKPAVTE